MEEQPASVVNELSVTRAQGGTAFRITDEQWSRLLVEVGGWPAPAPATDAVAAVVEQVVRGHPHGQGFGLDAQQRRAVELRAMEVTRAEFVSRGWEVSDVSATSPYDLLCRLGSELRRVEVKGTTGPPVAVLLTKNEVIAAQADPASAVLAIVHGIKLKVSSGGVTADEGQLLIIEPWHLNNADLMALAYRYTVPAI